MWMLGPHLLGSQERKETVVAELCMAVLSSLWLGWLVPRDSVLLGNTLWWVVLKKAAARVRGECLNGWNRQGWFAHLPLGFSPPQNRTGAALGEELNEEPEPRDLGCAHHSPFRARGE